MPGTQTMPSWHATGTRLTRAVLGYYLAVIGVITLVPFRFVVPERFHLMLTGTALDASANVLFFVPLGFLYRLAEPPARNRLRVLALGFGISTIVECAQLFAPERYASPLDVLANGAGAWLGAVLCDVAARRIRPDSLLVGRLSLEIPLMGLVYLLLPLLWLGSLGAGRETTHVLLLLLPGLFGGRLIALIRRHTPGVRDNGWSAGTVALAAGGGVLVGVVPAMALHPLLAPAIALVVALSVGVQTIVRNDPTISDRRFELPVLRSALPLYAAYLLAQAMTSRVTPGWLLPFPAEPAGTALGRTGILRLLEMGASFTVLGYLLAELRGRVDSGLYATGIQVLIRTLPLAALAIIARFLPGEAAAAALWFSIIVAASLYGALLYDFQRAHVLALIDAMRRAGGVRVDRAA
jgi:glycopeptide antibiotics resistance protein